MPLYVRYVHWLSVATLLVSAACAPLSDFRPPSALVQDDRHFEAGGGGVYVSPRPYVVEPAHGNAQFWFTGRPTKWLLLSGVGAFDDKSALGGVSALARFLKTDRFVAGTSVELGYAWAGFSLSGAVRLYDDAWIYTAPKISNWGKFPIASIPLGVSIPLIEGFALRAEAQASWEQFVYYNRRIHLGGAVVYAW